jgi:cob(I)alamin adenosyltransferase
MYDSVPERDPQPVDPREALVAALLQRLDELTQAVAVTTDLALQFENTCRRGFRSAERHLQALDARLRDD